MHYRLQPTRWRGSSSWQPVLRTRPPEDAWVIRHAGAEESRDPRWLSDYRMPKVGCEDPLRGLFDACRSDLAAARRLMG